LHETPKEDFEKQVENVAEVTTLFARGEYSW
jgi:hypothetical protein